MNWNIIDNPIKRTFRISIGHLSQEKGEKLLKELMNYKDFDIEEEKRKQTLIDRRLKIDKIRNGI